MTKGLTRAHVIAAEAEHDAAAQSEELTVIVRGIEVALIGLAENHPSGPWLRDALKASLKLAQVTERLRHYRDRFRLPNLKAAGSS